jgi:hypothetical protein
MKPVTIRRRLIIGTITEYAFIIAAIAVVIILIGNAFAWISDHLPDWFIYPGFAFIYAAGWWAVFKDHPISEVLGNEDNKKR